MPIRFRCPACGRELSAPDEAAGAAGPCAYCHVWVTAPSAPGEPAGLAEQPPAGPEGEGTPSGPEEAPGRYGLLVPPSGRLDRGTYFAEAYQTTVRFPGPIIGGFLLVCLVTALVLGVWGTAFTLVAGGLNAQGMPNLTADPPTILLLAIGAILCLLLVPLWEGPFYVIDAVLARGQADVTLLFRGYQYAPSLVGTALLIQVALLPAAALMNVLAILQSAHVNDTVALAVGIPLWVLGFIVSQYIGTSLSLAPMEVIDRGAGAMEAIRVSWATTPGHRMRIFAIMILFALLVGIGALLCGVGALVVAPLYLVARVLIYRDLRGLRAATTAGA